jgi:hypothetical protein
MQWLIAKLMILVYSPAVRAVALSFLEDAYEHGTELVPVAYNLIRDNAFSTSLTGEQKFQNVFDGMKAKFPDVADSLLNTVIQASYREVKKTLNS